MPHTLYFTACSGNSFKPALVLRQERHRLAAGREHAPDAERADHARAGGFELERFGAVLRWMERVRGTAEYAQIADVLKP